MAIVTGSRVYGIPKSDSDIDLVVLVTPADLKRLMTVAGEVVGGSAGGERCIEASLRFGKLNLLCVTDPVAYHVWERGTRELRDNAPVTRDVAVAMFQLLQKHCGVNEDYPDCQDARNRVARHARVDES